MKYLFFGSPEFAAVILEKLIAAGYVPAAVVCNPDRPIGRKKVITPPPVKRAALDHNNDHDNDKQIIILQPEKLDDGFRSRLSDLFPELVEGLPTEKSEHYPSTSSGNNVLTAIVAAYAKIIPKSVLDLFPKGVIGVHPSLLPKYRGATPIQSVILGGEETTGVTLYLLDEKLDHGPILAQQKFEIRNSKFEILVKELAELGSGLLVETLPKFIAESIKPVAQNETEATYTKKFTSEDAFVAQEMLDAALNGDKKKAIEISRKIRALNPEPGAWTLRPLRPASPKTASRGGQAQGIKAQGKPPQRVKLLEADVKDGKLVLKKIQFEGKKPEAI